MERILTLVQHKDTVMVPESIELHVSLTEIVELAFMFHGAALPTMNQSQRLVCGQED